MFSKVLLIHQFCAAHQNTNITRLAVSKCTTTNRYCNYTTITTSSTHQAADNNPKMKYA